MVSSTNEEGLSVWFIKENTIATNFDPKEFAISVQSTKIGYHENKTIHSIWYMISIYESAFKFLIK